VDDVAFLEEMLRIPSLSGQEKALSEWLVDRMSRLGLEADCDAVGNAVGIGGDPSAERTVLLLGHMDTVRGQIPIHRQDGCLYGRGAVDAKGPLAAFVLSAARVAADLRGVRVVVVGAVEEEAHGRGAQYLKETVPPPDCAIVGEPSGWDGITLGYKGLVSVHYRWESSVTHGASDHQTPAEKAIGFWDHVRTCAAGINRGRTGTFDVLSPSLREIHTFSDGIRAWAEMDLVLRLPLDLSPQSVRDLLAARHPDEHVSFPYGEPAYRSGKNSALVRAFLRAIRDASGRPRFKLKTGTSDMNVVGPAWDCPIVAYGPGDSDLDHTPSEHIEIAEYRRSISILTQVLRALASELRTSTDGRRAQVPTQGQDCAWASFAHGQDGTP